MIRAMQADSGVVKGNLGATIVLLIIIALSFVLVMLTIVVPALPSVRRIPRRLIGAGTAISCSSDLASCSSRSA